MALNLLPSQAKFQADKIKLQSKINKYLMGISFVWLLAVISTLGFQLYNRSRLNTAISNNKNLMTTYTKESKQIVLSNRLKYQVKQIGGILNERFEYSTPFTMVEKIFPESVKVDNYELVNREGFKITGTLKGNKNIALLEDKQAEINEGKINGFSKASLINLSTKSGFWNFSMEVDIKNGSK